MFPILPYLGNGTKPSCHSSFQSSNSVGTGSPADLRLVLIVTAAKAGIQGYGYTPFSLSEIFCGELNGRQEKRVLVKFIGE
jgi:hypothetical protein